MPELSVSEFADRINDLMPELLRGVLKRDTDQICCGKITMPQLLVCDYLYKEGLSNMTALANFMGVTTAAATGIVDRLVKSGFVGRQYDAQDRRVINIELSAKGREMVRKFKEGKRRMTVEVFKNLTEADRKNYLRIMTRIKDILSRGQSAD